MKKKNKLFLISMSENQGSLLVEVMLSVVLFTIMAMTIASTIRLSSVLYRTNDAHARLNQNAMKTLHYIGEEIRKTSTASTRLAITDHGTNPDEVSFKIPVDFDNDGDVTLVDNDSPSQWGAYSYIGQTQVNDATIQNKWVQYSVQPNLLTKTNQLMRKVCPDTLCAQPTPGIAPVVVSDNIYIDPDPLKNKPGFNVTLNADDSITITINLQTNDAVGQAGKSRPLSADFTYTVFLRNAAN